MDVVFGPVPSRRLGRSLGVNNIPPKICSYSCIYCQLGILGSISIERKRFYEVDKLVRSVKKKVMDVKRKEDRIDYITFVPDGEPTLDANLGEEARGIKDIGIDVAIITNASLIWREDVREDLENFDLVSLKIDSVNPEEWKKINRPHPSLNQRDILLGIEKFSKDYHGIIITETMLIQNINDSKESIENVARFIRGIRPHRSYLSIPTRPPADINVRGTNENNLNFAYNTFRDFGIDVELLTGYEGDEFSLTGDFERDILAILSVHPMREDAIYKLILKYGVSYDILEKLIKKEEIKSVRYRGKKFYIRRFKHRRTHKRGI